MTRGCRGPADVDEAPDAAGGLAGGPRLAASPENGREGDSDASFVGPDAVGRAAWMRKAEKAFRGHTKPGPRSECWPWTGNNDSRGYGLVRVQRRLWRAHRVSWILHHGPIPEGLFVLHACDNPTCVNPSHLMLGTARANAMDAARKGRMKGATVVGEQNGRAKLCEEDVRAMRDNPGRRYCDIAREFGISLSTAWNAKNGKTWRHLR